MTFYSFKMIILETLSIKRKWFKGKINDASIIKLFLQSQNDGRYFKKNIICYTNYNVEN